MPRRVAVLNIDIYPRPSRAAITRSFAAGIKIAAVIFWSGSARLATERRNERRRVRARSPSLGP